VNHRSPAQDGGDLRGDDRLAPRVPACRRRSGQRLDAALLAIRFGPDLEANPVTHAYVRHELSVAEKHYEAAASCTTAS
jgi:hypothetical protein